MLRTRFSTRLRVPGPMLDVPHAAKPATKPANAPTAAATPAPAELTGKQVFKLFPTPMFTGMLSDITICDRVEKKLRELQRAGRGTTAGLAMRAYMSPDDLQ